MTNPTFARPEYQEIERVLRVLEPWRILTSPKIYGLDRIPDSRPLLFVGNHTLFGVLDVPMLFRELVTQRDIFLRSLGDHLHFKVPLWRDFLLRYGVVPGSRKNCAQLMESGECILVFPGGGREVAKRKGEKYKLIWKERIGFARMAVRYGCTIVPFSAIGVEDAYDILLDVGDLLASPLGPLVKKLGVRYDILWPIVKGAGPTPLPRPHRLYFRIGEPVETAGLGGDFDNTDLCKTIRDRVRSEIELGIEWLQRARQEDPKRNFLPRVMGELKQLVEKRASGRPSAEEDR